MKKDVIDNVDFLIFDHARVQSLLRTAACRVQYITEYRKLPMLNWVAVVGWLACQLARTVGWGVWMASGTRAIITGSDKKDIY